MLFSIVVAIRALFQNTCKMQVRTTVISNLHFASKFYNNRDFPELSPSPMATSKERSDCPISRSLEIWGDKWSLLIIRDLMFAKKCSYGDFLKSPEKIATNILASRLEMLEKNTFIKKTADPNGSKKTLYALTKKGVDMLPILVEIQLWAEKHLSIPEDKKAETEEMRSDKEGFIRRSYEKLGAGSELK